MAGFVAVGGVAVGAFAGGFVLAVEDAAAQADIEAGIIAAVQGAVGPDGGVFQPGVFGRGQHSRQAQLNVLIVS